MRITIKINDAVVFEMTAKQMLSLLSYHSVEQYSIPPGARIQTICYNGTKAVIHNEIEKPLCHETRGTTLDLHKRPTMYYNCHFTYCPDCGEELNFGDKL